MTLRICVAPGCEELAVPGLARCAEHGAEAARREALRREAAKAGSAAWSHLYQTPEWKRAAKRFLALHPVCRDCEALGVIKVAVEVDHVVPHRGDRGRFWDRTNWQPLCKPCHSRKTAREVRKGATGG